VKNQLSSKFDMKDLIAANFILGMEIKRDREKKETMVKLEDTCRDNIA
jgi:hypothetical protein